MTSRSSLIAARQETHGATVYAEGQVDGAAAERARIIAWLRDEADHGPVGGGPACRYVADLIERGA